MKNKTFIESAKIMAKGQITIPKDIREILGVDCGDRVTFVVEGDTVRIVNSTIYAMQTIQKAMEGEAERVGLTDDDKIMDLIREIRYGGL